MSDAELAGFVRGYIEPNKAAAVRDAGQTYERLLREVAPDLRPELTAHHHELAWQVAFAWRDEEITKLDALRELVANHQVSAAPPSRKADASVITTGQLSWQPPADDPGAAAVNLRYQIRESDHPPYTAAWRQRGVAQRAWLDSLTELREAKK